jgi:hypothetical protein
LQDIGGSCCIEKLLMSPCLNLKNHGLEGNQATMHPIGAIECSGMAEWQGNVFLKEF